MNDENLIRGKIYLTYNRFMLHQPPTQVVEGGLSNVYKKFGTYVKSFYSVMIWPSGVKVAMMGVKHPRIHHKVIYNATVPCIVREDIKK